MALSITHVHEQVYQTTRATCIIVTQFCVTHFRHEAQDIHKTLMLACTQLRNVYAPFTSPVHHTDVQMTPSL